MIIIAKRRNRKEYLWTPEEAREALMSGEYRGACLSETMGPNWKDIYWTPRKDGSKDRCYVKR